jgi:hypothetical protein
MQRCANPPRCVVAGASCGASLPPSHILCASDKSPWAARWYSRRCGGTLACTQRYQAAAAASLLGVDGDQQPPRARSPPNTLHSPPWLSAQSSSCSAPVRGALQSRDIHAQTLCIRKDKLEGSTWGHEGARGGGGGGTTAVPRTDPQCECHPTPAIPGWSDLRRTSTLCALI